MAPVNPGAMSWWVPVYDRKAGLNVVNEVRSPA